MEPILMYEGEPIRRRFRQAVHVVMIDHGDDGHDVSDQVEPHVDYRIGDVLTLSWDGTPRTFVVRRTDRRGEMADDGTFSREWIVAVSVSVDRGPTP